MSYFKVIKFSQPFHVPLSEINLYDRHPSRFNWVVYGENTSEDKSISLLNVPDIL